MTTKKNELKSFSIFDTTKIQFENNELSSTRLKLHKIREQDEYEEKEETYSDFVEKIDKHSSFREILNYENDIENSIGSSLHKTKPSAKNSLMISNKPSLTSKGFENSFKLLQNQVKANTKKKIQLLETLNSNHKLSTSFETNIFTVKEEDPTRLELELEALERIKTYISNLEIEKHNEQILKNGHISASHLGLLYNFVSKGLSKSNVVENSAVSKNLMVQDSLNGRTDDNSNLKYHVGKSASGEKCLKIIPSFSNHEKGTFSFSFNKIIILYLNS